METLFPSVCHELEQVIYSSTDPWAKIQKRMSDLDGDFEHTDPITFQEEVSRITSEQEDPYGALLLAILDCHQDQGDPIIEVIERLNLKLTHR